MTDEIRERFAAAGCPLADDDFAFFERLRAAVVAGNETQNLTRLLEPEDFFVKHVLDSWLPFVHVPELAALKQERRVADVGSGAGFPGFVLARLRPTWTVTLIERRQKKAVFLEETAAALGLGNVRVLARDAREAAAELEGACHLVTARAVGRLGAVTDAAAPLLAHGTLLAHYKGALAEDERTEGAKAAFRHGFEQLEPVAYELPPDARRTVVLVVNRSRRRRRAAAFRRRRAT